MELWKKQKKVLTAFGIFLAFMFVCTLVSRAVYASMLPQVTVDTPRRMAINHKVEAEGIVHQGREYAINVLSGLRVRTVYVHVGDRVTPETLLFDLDTDDLTEQIQEKELAVKKLQFQISDMELNRNLDTQKKQTESERAQEDYARTESEAGEKVERAEEDLDDAEDALDDLRDHPAEVTSEEERKAAYEEYEAWVQEEAELKEEFETAQEEYEAAQAEVKRLEEEAASGSKTKGEAADGAGNGTEGEAADGAGDGTENEADGIPQKLEKAREAESAAKERCESAQAAYQTHMDNAVSEPDFSAEDEAEAAWEAKKDSLKDAVETAKRAVEDAKQSESDAMLEAKRKVADANTADSADSSLEISRLELASMQTELTAYKKILDAGGQVYPEAEGIITRIQVSPGERAPDGAAVVYADLSSPMQFYVSLTKDQKKYVNQGDTIELSLGGSRAEEYTVDYVAENEANPELYDVRIFLPDGVGTIGQSGSFEAETQSETFSCCIPVDALREDANHRSYVYKVGKKSGILGAELAAEKIYVKVLDQNDSYAAIEEGVIDRETELIIASTETLEDQDVIRYKE